VASLFRVIYAEDALLPVGGCNELVECITVSHSLLRLSAQIVHPVDHDSDAPPLFLTWCIRDCEREFVPRAKAIAPAEGCPPAREATVTLPRGDAHLVRDRPRPPFVVLHAQRAPLHDVVFVVSRRQRKGGFLLALVGCFVQCTCCKKLGAALFASTASFQVLVQCSRQRARASSAIPLANMRRSLSLQSSP